MNDESMKVKSDLHGCRTTSSETVTRMKPDSRGPTRARKNLALVGIVTRGDLLAKCSFTRSRRSRSRPQQLDISFARLSSWQSPRAIPTDIPFSNRHDHRARGRRCHTGRTNPCGAKRPHGHRSPAAVDLAVRRPRPSRGCPSAPTSWARTSPRPPARTCACSWRKSTASRP